MLEKARNRKVRSFARMTAVAFVHLGLVGGMIAAADESGKIKFGGSWRVRVERWDWFEPHGNFDNDYTFVGSLLKANVSQSTRDVDWMVELSQPTLLFVPANSVAPGAEGQLGLGAAHSANNNGQDATLFVHQAYLRFKHFFSEHTSLCLGRFEFAEGREAMPEDATLAWLKQKRIAERLLSTFFFTDVQTALDGAQFVWDSPKLNIDLLAARMTSGGVRLNGWDEIDVNVLYGALTVPLPQSQGRLFVAAVDDLSQRSNVLAVNAAIEAAKAGAFGKGFSVVASEVKNLAGQSREATTQVRTILGDIQKASDAALIATEKGGRVVELGTGHSFQAGQSIHSLSDSISEAAQAASEIALSSQEQFIGIDQVAAAMESVRRASTQNAEGAKQLESAARRLNDLGQRLSQLTEAQLSVDRSS
jgi:hypothetical protein